jgi:hypothetical protein
MEAEKPAFLLLRAVQQMQLLRNRFNCCEPALPWINDCHNLRVSNMGSQGEKGVLSGYLGLTMADLFLFLMEAWG